MLPQINSILLLFFLLLQNFCFANESDYQATFPLVPVVNQQLKQDSITRQGLSAIFKMRLHRWKDGTPVTVFVLADDNPLHKAFCKTILNVFPHQMRRTWDRMVFSGSGQAPIQLTDKKEMIERLSSTPGAIGYLPTNDLNENIKILHIQSNTQ